MPKFEYLVVEERNSNYYAGRYGTLTDLKVLENDGWELVSNAGDGMVFKRQNGADSEVGYYEFEMPRLG
jgi:hypothetical protein